MEPNEIADNLTRVRTRIATAARRVGRQAEEITLIAVSKTVASEAILAAYAAGVRDFGENYVQEARTKIGQPPLNALPIRWHFLGHLQRNKVKEVVTHFVLIQSVDSLSLAQEMAHRAQAAGRKMDILLEVKLDPAETKFGLLPEQTLAIAEQIRPLTGVRLCGLMGMAPFAAEPEASRPAFRQLHQLFKMLPVGEQQVLSMGMSGDFEVAIEEGATHVRIGTAIFGPRR